MRTLSQADAKIGDLIFQSQRNSTGDGVNFVE